MRSLILVAVLALSNVSDVTRPVDWGTVSVAEWETLRGQGWRGVQWDGTERIYPPSA